MEDGFPSLRSGVPLATLADCLRAPCAHHPHTTNTPPTHQPHNNGVLFPLATLGGSARYARGLPTGSKAYGLQKPTGSKAYGLQKPTGSTVRPLPRAPCRRTAPLSALAAALRSARSAHSAARASRRASQSSRTPRGLARSVSGRRARKYLFTGGSRSLRSRGPSLRSGRGAVLGSGSGACSPALRGRLLALTAAPRVVYYIMRLCRARPLAAALVTLASSLAGPRPLVRRRGGPPSPRSVGRSFVAPLVGARGSLRSAQGCRLRRRGFLAARRRRFRASGYRFPVADPLR